MHAKRVPLTKEEKPMLHYFLTWFRTLKRGEGQDLAEYALLLALIAVALVLVLAALAGGIANIFNRVRVILEKAPGT